MKSLPERIMEHAEATPRPRRSARRPCFTSAKRAAVGQALSRLARSGRLMRIRQGVYMRPIQTRFGRCAPSTEKSLLALSELWRETIVSNGGGAANWLGLTTQNPVRSVYLTSGRSRRLRFGKHPVELRHAPRWQLAAPHRMAGVVIRALAWLGPEEVEDSLDATRTCTRECPRFSYTLDTWTWTSLWLKDSVLARRADSPTISTAITGRLRQYLAVLALHLAAAVVQEPETPDRPHWIKPIALPAHNLGLTTPPDRPASRDRIFRLKAAARATSACSVPLNVVFDAVAARKAEEGVGSSHEPTRARVDTADWPKRSLFMRNYQSPLSGWSVR